MSKSQELTPSGGVRIPKGSYRLPSGGYVTPTVWSEPDKQGRRLGVTAVLRDNPDPKKIADALVAIAIELAEQERLKAAGDSKAA